MKYTTDDLRIKSIDEVLYPAQVHGEFPITDAAAATVHDTRQAIHEVLYGSDDRLLVVVGPCSIHDTEAACDYARRLKVVRERLQEDLLVVMRIYFEKPRTTVGWKGLINDPDVDDSFQINKGLRIARCLLRDINDVGVPAGTEFLDLITPQYVADLISWGAIGARTTESQVHRELASGLSCPVGFKNGTDGNLKIALDAVRASRRPHHFLSMTKLAHSAIFTTAGNEDCHVILRGGKEPNYQAECVLEAAQSLAAAGLPDRVMVDFSHANSRKQYQLQVEVAGDVSRQLADGQAHIMGVMIESHLVAGRQDVKPGQSLVYGQSITDACIGWEDTEQVLEDLAGAVRARREAVGPSSTAAS